MNLFLRGLILGVSIAAPVGPIGVLCIRRTLAEGRAVGFVSGLGAASADALYGCIAGFGLTAVSGLLVRQQTWLGILGGLFLCGLGLRTLGARPVPDAMSAGMRTSGRPAADAPAHTTANARPGGGKWAAYGTVFLLTLTNPMTILSFTAMFAGLGLAGGANGYAGAGALVTGVFLGSAAWWLALSAGVSLFRQRFDGRAMRWVNTISGAVILLFGISALARVAGSAWLGRR